MPAPACSNTLPKRRNPDGNKTAQEGTNTRCGRTEKDRLLTRLPFPQGRGPHHLQSPYSPQLSRPSLRTAPVQNDMYTRREVYISDPAPYRQTLTCTAKDVFANDQAPAPDNNATVRNQDTPSLFVLLPSCSEQDEYRAALPSRIRTISGPAFCRLLGRHDRASAHSPLCTRYSRESSVRDYKRIRPASAQDGLSHEHSRSSYLQETEADNKEKDRQTKRCRTGCHGEFTKKKSPQECIPRRLMENCRIVIRTLSGSVSLRAHATHCLPRLQARSRPA